MNPVILRHGVSLNLLVTPLDTWRDFRVFCDALVQSLALVGKGVQLSLKSFLWTRVTANVGIFFSPPMFMLMIFYCGFITRV